MLPTNRFFTILLSAAHLGAATYTVQTLSYPGATQTYAQAVNASGVVAGYYTDTTGTSHGFIWYGGKFTAVDIPGTSGTWLTGINDSTDLCGYVHVAGGTIGTSVGFEITGGAFKTFSAPTARNTFPGGINNSGVISGDDETGTVASATYGGFILSSATGGTFSTLDVTGQTNTWAGSLNDLSDAVGFAGADLNPTTPVQAFAYKHSRNKLLSVSMPGMVQTRIYGINNAGTIVGYGLDSTQTTHAFTYQSGTFTPFAIPGATVAIPQGISNAGVIVGYALSGASSVVGFVATP